MEESEMKKIFIVLLLFFSLCNIAIANDWNFTSITDPINDLKTDIFSLESDALNTNHEMTLEIRHNLNATNDLDKDLILIGIHENTLTPESTITIRFDKNKAYTEAWVVNGQNDCLVWPNAVYFISTILKSSKLAIRINNGYKEMTSVFNVIGLADMVKKHNLGSIEWLKNNYIYDEENKIKLIDLYNNYNIKLDTIPFAKNIWRYVIINYDEYSGNDDQIKNLIMEVISQAKQNDIKMPMIQRFYISYDLTNKYYEYVDY